MTHSLYDDIRYVVGTTTIDEAATESFHGVLLDKTSEITEVALDSILSAVAPITTKCKHRSASHYHAACGGLNENCPGWTCVLDDLISGQAKEGLSGLAPEMVDLVPPTSNLVRLKLSSLQDFDSDPASTLRPDDYLRLSASSFSKLNPGRGL